MAQNLSIIKNSNGDPFEMKQLKRRCEDEGDNFIQNKVRVVDLDNYAQAYPMKSDKMIIPKL